MSIGWNAVDTAANAGNIRLGFHLEVETSRYRWSQNTGVIPTHCVRATNRPEYHTVLS